MTDFDKAFDLISSPAIEGGYVNDTLDPGGETNIGITEVTLRRAIAEGIVPAEITIRTLTQAQSKVIYRAFYWDAVRSDELPWPLSLLVFDAAVNQGVDAAIRVLQKTLGIAIDGKLGPKTLAVAKRAGREQVALYLADRALRYTGTRNFDRFGRGWLKRLFLLAFDV